MIWRSFDGRGIYTPVKIDMKAVAGGQEITMLGNGSKKYFDQLCEADLLVLDIIVM